MKEGSGIHLKNPILHEERSLTRQLIRAACRLKRILKSHSQKKIVPQDNSSENLADLASKAASHLHKEDKDGSFKNLVSKAKFIIISIPHLSKTLKSVIVKFSIPQLSEILKSANLQRL